MLPIVHDFVRIAIECGWAYFDDLAWFKDEISGSKTNFGSLASCSAPGLARNHEHILLFFEVPFKLDGDPALSDLDRDSHLGWWTTGWHIKPEVDKQIRGIHPAPMPEEIPKRLITMLTYRGDIVVNPFNGSGTVTAVANRSGRRFVGIDQSEKYCALARQRTTRSLRLAESSDRIPNQALKTAVL